MGERYEPVHRQDLCNMLGKNLSGVHPLLVWKQASQDLNGSMIAHFILLKK